LVSTDLAVLRQDPEGVVDRLSRDRADLGANGFGDLLGLAVRSFRDRSEHGQSLGCDLEPMFAKAAGRFVIHGDSLTLDLY
jgi:hypothetical protein